ncbi:MAG: NACHT domain-containing protein, partial [Proteobacteria bacterium]|nr:NACHT domain-containing protein [Pseudomonadota bacterium]
MEKEISRVLTDIKEKSRSVCTNHLKHYVCNLKNVYVDELELSELVLEKEPDTEMGSDDGKQVRVPYSSIFDPQLTKVKSDAARKTVLIQGEAAVGKTMLCLSVMEEWASGKRFQEFQLILLLPLRS